MVDEEVTEGTTRCFGLGVSVCFVLFLNIFYAAFNALIVALEYFSANKH